MARHPAPALSASDRRVASVSEIMMDRTRTAELPELRRRTREAVGGYGFSQ
jgi:hypothetical protein